MPEINIDFAAIIQAIGALLEVAALCFGALVAAFWISLMVWTFRDIRARTHDAFFQILSVLLVLTFNVLGLFLYLMLRPRETLAERYEQALAEEALLQDIEERQFCPTCQVRVEHDYLLCPACRTQLRQRCPDCGRLNELTWTVCPYCGHVYPPLAAEETSQVEEVKIEEEPLQQTATQRVEWPQ